MSHVPLCGGHQGSIYPYRGCPGPTAASDLTLVPHLAEGESDLSGSYVMTNMYLCRLLLGESTEAAAEETTEKQPYSSLEEQRKERHAPACAFPAFTLLRRAVALLICVD